MRACGNPALNISGTDAVIFTAKTRNLDAGEVIESCPYNIPRKASDGTMAKCDMGYDRVYNGFQPACVKVDNLFPFSVLFCSRLSYNGLDLPGSGNKLPLARAGPTAGTMET
jgi:hypothetical protein